MPSPIINGEVSGQETPGRHNLGLTPTENSPNRKFTESSGNCRLPRPGSPIDEQNSSSMSGFRTLIFGWSSPLSSSFRRAEPRTLRRARWGGSFKGYSILWMLARGAGRSARGQNFKGAFAITNQTSRLEAY